MVTGRKEKKRKTGNEAAKENVTIDEAEESNTLRRSKAVKMTKSD